MILQVCMRLWFPEEVLWHRSVDRDRCCCCCHVHCQSGECCWMFSLSIHWNSAIFVLEQVRVSVFSLMWCHVMTLMTFSVSGALHLYGAWLSCQVVARSASDLWGCGSLPAGQLVRPLQKNDRCWRAARSGHRGKPWWDHVDGERKQMPMV